MASHPAGLLVEPPSPTQHTLCLCHNTGHASRARARSTSHSTSHPTPRALNTSRSYVPMCLGLTRPFWGVLVQGGCAPPPTPPLLSCTSRSPSTLSSPSLPVPSAEHAQRKARKARKLKGRPPVPAVGGQALSSCHQPSSKRHPDHTALHEQLIHS